MPEKGLQGEKPEYPTIEQFEGMSVDDKLLAFTSLPIIAQQLLIRLTGFSVSISEELFQFFKKDLTTNKTDPDTGKVITPAAYTPEDFDTGVETLLQGPFLNKMYQLHVSNENAAFPGGLVSIANRYQVAPSMRQFINTDLRKIWEEQQRNRKPKK